MTSATRFAARDSGGLASLPPATIMLWFFMGVVTMLFFLFTIAFLARSQSPDWHSLADPSQPLANRWALWANTAMLLASSLMLEFATRSARRGNRARTKFGLALGGLLAIGFIAGQLSVWQQLSEAGYFLTSNPANSFFYVITGLHGLHLAGGLVAWAHVSLRAWRGGAIERLRLGVELTTRYWHFLLIVWLAMFALIASPESITKTLARLCGIG